MAASVAIELAERGQKAGLKDKVISMQGLLQKPDDAMIWRGPVKIGVIKQKAVIAKGN